MSGCLSHHVAGCFCQTTRDNKPDFNQVLYLRTMPMQGSETVKDVCPSNNVLPILLAGKYLLGDVNNDRVVDAQDASLIMQKVAGKITW